MHYIAQETHALHYTRNTENKCTKLDGKHMLYITQEANEIHNTGNSYTTSHWKQMLYIT